MDFSLTPFLLLAIVAGYKFTNEWEHTRYRLARERGHRLYFEATLYGMLLTALVLLTLIIARAALPPLLSMPASETVSKWLLSVNFQEMSLASLIITPLFSAFAARLLNRYSQENQHFYKAIQHNDFELMLVDAAASDKMVMVTMEDEKVYVGWVYSTSEPASIERNYFSLIPVISGYRNSTTRKVEFTTFYQQVFDKTEDEIAHLEIDDFVVVLPIRRSLSIRRFDPEAYATFQTLQIQSS